MCDVRVVGMEYGIGKVSLESGMSWVGHCTESEDDFSVLEIWEVWNISSLPLLWSSLWQVLAVPVRAPSMDQIDLLKNIHIRWNYVEKNNS